MLYLVPYLDLNEKRRWEKMGGSQILGWMYARGVGVIQMRTVCNRRGGGSKIRGKMRT